MVVGDGGDTVGWSEPLEMILGPNDSSLNEDTAEASSAIAGHLFVAILIAPEKQS